MSLLQMSLSGGAMILAAMLVRAFALHSLPKRFFVILWALALIRLTVPFSLPAACSVYSLLSPREPLTQPVTVSTAAPSPGTWISETAPLLSGPAPAPAAVNPWALFWLMGLLLCAARFTFAYVKCCREFREALPVHDHFVDDWLLAHKLRRPISIRQSDRITAPLTYGVLRPVILLPKSMDLGDAEALNYVLTHEWIHIRRFDGAFKLWLTAALCVHWFNPLVWLMVFLADRDVELSCDQAVLQLFGRDARSGYAMVLLHMEEHRGGLTVMGSHFSKNSLEERIKAMMKMKKTSLAALLAALVLVGGMGAVFATSAQAEEQKAAPGSYFTGEKQVSDMMIWEEPDKLTYSTDGGQTWASATHKEFTSVFSISNVEWWHAEEYAAWLENEKKELQSIIGSKGWTPSTGWFTWTQEMVDETIAEYEKVLAMIEDGCLVSKSMDGDENAMIMSGALAEALETVESDVKAAEKYVELPEALKSELSAFIEAWAEENYGEYYALSNYEDTYYYSSVSGDKVETNVMVTFDTTLRYESAEDLPYMEGVKDALDTDSVSQAIEDGMAPQISEQYEDAAEAIGEPTPLGVDLHATCSYDGTHATGIVLQYVNIDGSYEDIGVLALPSKEEMRSQGRDSVTSAK